MYFLAPLKHIPALVRLIIDAVRFVVGVFDTNPSRNRITSSLTALNVNAQAPEVCSKILSEALGVFFSASFFSVLNLDYYILINLTANS